MAKDPIFGPISRTEIADLWRHIARTRKKNGDTEGARIAYRNANVYARRGDVGSLVQDIPLYGNKRRVKT
jgi:hypothetical protein